MKIPQKQKNQPAAIYTLANSVYVQNSAQKTNLSQGKNKNVCN